MQQVAGDHAIASKSLALDAGPLWRVLPGALPYVMTGLRLGLAQAWRVLVAATLYRVLFGFGLAVAIGLPLGALVTRA